MIYSYGVMGVASSHFDVLLTDAGRHENFDARYKLTKIVLWLNCFIKESELYTFINSEIT